MLWLLLSAGTCLVGLLAGALAMFLAVLFSAGAPSAGADREALVAILKEYKVSDEHVLEILKKGLNRWALLRWKTRPLLWRIGYKWPEHGELSERELEIYFGNLVPASPPSFAPLAIQEPGSPEESAPGGSELPDAFLPPNLEDVPASDSGTEPALNL